MENDPEVHTDGGHRAVGVLVVCFLLGALSIAGLVIWLVL